MCLLVLLASGPAPATCLSYGGEVHLRGTLVFREYPGPPDYNEKSPPLTLWFLTLPETACVDADPNPATRPINTAANGLKEIQVMPAYPPGAGAFRNLRGKDVKLSGTLRGRMGRDQKTPVVLSDARVEEPAKPTGR